MSVWGSRSLLDEYPVHQDKSERNNEKNVGEVEDKLGDIVLGTIPLHVPVGDADLEQNYTWNYQL